MKRLLLLFTSGMVILLLLFFITLPTLMISSQDKVEQVVYNAERISFSIRWEHSVEKEEWEEMFRVNNGQIILDATRFKTFGAGVPSDAGEETFIKDGWVYMTDIHQPIGEELVIKTGRTTDHRIIREGAELELKASTSYKISIEKVTLLEVIGYYILTRMR